MQFSVGMTASTMMLAQICETLCAINTALGLTQSVTVFHLLGSLHLPGCFQVDCGNLVCR